MRVATCAYCGNAHGNHGYAHFRAAQVLKTKNAAGKR
jgi:hypothetical protein